MYPAEKPILAVLLLIATELTLALIELPPGPINTCVDKSALIIQKIDEVICSIDEAFVFKLTKVNEAVLLPIMNGSLMILALTVVETEPNEQEILDDKVAI